MKRFSPLSLAAAFVVAANPTPKRMATTDWISAVKPIPSPAGGNTAQPQLASQGDRLLVSWIERTGDRATLKYADRTTTG